MSRGMKFRIIEREIEGLSSEDQLKLVEKLAQELRKKGLGGKKGLDWKVLYGLGEGLWKGEDAQEYIDRLREDRM